MRMVKINLLKKIVMVTRSYSKKRPQKNITTDPMLFSVIFLELSFTVYLGVTRMMEVHFYSII